MAAGGRTFHGDDTVVQRGEDTLEPWTCSVQCPNGVRVQERLTRAQGLLA